MNTILGYPNEIDNKDVKIPDQNIWISIDQHTASKLIATKGVFSSQTLNSQTKQAGFIIINGHKSLLSEISQFMHDKFHQCFTMNPVTRLRMSVSREATRLL